MSDSRRAAASSERLRLLAAARWRVALALTIAMMVVYFGFILLVAFDKPLLARTIVPGLSLGILLGVLVIVAAWILIAVYVRWANRHYDAAIATLEERAMTTSLGQPNATAIIGFLLFIALSLGDHLVGRAAHADHGALLRRRPEHQRLPERPRARRRLHERGELPRHRRPRRRSRASTA